MEFAIIARKARPRGNRGELEAIPLSECPERVKRVFLRQAPFEVEWVFRNPRGVVFKLRGVDSISAAEGFAGADICIPIEERPQLPEGEYYLSDLLGCLAVERSTGRVLGSVQDWQEYGGPPLLEIATPDGREILVPFAKSICVVIDPDAKRIEMDLPEGLDEL